MIFIFKFIEFLFAEQRSEQPPNHHLQRQKAKQQPVLSTGITMAGTVAHFGNQPGSNYPSLKSSNNGLSKKESKKNNKRNVKIPRKEDISSPTGFKYVFQNVVKDF